MITTNDDPADPLDSTDLNRRLKLAIRSGKLSKEAATDLCKMWGFARLLDAAVHVALEDEGF